MNIIGSVEAEMWFKTWKKGGYFSVDVLELFSETKGVRKFVKTANLSRIAWETIL